METITISELEKEKNIDKFFDMIDKISEWLLFVIKEKDDTKITNWRSF